MKIVFDTNVLISASLWDTSFSHKLFIKLIKENAEIFTSVEILNEYKKVVMRDFKYSEEEVDNIITKFLVILKIVKPLIKIDAVKADFGDNKIIECAVFSNSKFILTYDKHLLNLKEYENIKIIKPEEIFGIK